MGTDRDLYNHEWYHEGIGNAAPADDEHAQEEFDRTVSYQARLVKKRPRDLENIIAEFPDQKKREALTKTCLLNSVKQLSAPQKKRPAVTLKSVGASGTARVRVPPNPA